MAQAAPTVRIVATEFALQPSIVHVPVGRSVHLMFDNKGAIEHNVHAPGTSLQLQAPAGQVAMGDFRFDTPGEYELVCALPGHDQAGMRAKLIVDAGTAATSAQTAPTAQAVAVLGPAGSTMPAMAGPTAGALPAGLAGCRSQWWLHRSPAPSRWSCRSRSRLRR